MSHYPFRPARGRDNLYAMNTFPDIEEALSDAERAAVWRALSELCLDTEITDTMVAAIARTLVAQGVGIAEAEHILYTEIVPPLFINMTGVAGVWSGFDPVWLEAKIRQWRASAWRQAAARIMRPAYRCMVGDDWARVAQAMATIAEESPE